MGYSCAYYERPDMAPVEASRANLARVCRLLDLRSADRLLEMGSGWGGMALHAAVHYGCQVSTVTISPSQRDYIQALARDAGVADRVEVVMSDYRDVRGSWDKLVSLEMVESIGAQHLGAFIGQCGTHFYFRHCDPVDAKFFGEIVALPALDPLKVKHQLTQSQQYQDGFDVVVLDPSKQKRRADEGDERARE